MNVNSHGRDRSTFFVYLLHIFTGGYHFSTAFPINPPFIAEELSLDLPVDGVVLAGRLPLHRAHAPRPRGGVHRPGGQSFFVVVVIVVFIGRLPLFWSLYYSEFFPSRRPNGISGRAVEMGYAGGGAAMCRVKCF